MDGMIPRRTFLAAAGAATAAAATLSPTLSPAADNPAPAASPADVAEQFGALHEFIPAAKAKLSKDAWTYLTGAVETETTMKRNRLMLDSIALRTRVLRGVFDLDTTGKLLGHEMRIPVMLSGIGSIGAMDPGGAATAARAASKFNVPLGVSSVAKPGLEETAAAAPGAKIYQLYVRGDDAWVDDVVRRLIASGYTALAFSVDSPVFSRRERDIVARGRNWQNSDKPDPYTAGLTWDQVKRVKDKFDIPLAIKGITTPEDAEIAVEHGVSVVWVSNHGGRQLDHGRASIEILPEVVEAVRGRAQIIVDSGFSRGTDVIKAIATGADAVAIGRLYCYGIGAAGEAGVTRVLEILEKEIREAMALMGVTKLAQLNKSYLRPALAVNPPGLWSAFPLLEMTS